jgi:hypothetical protein
MGRKIICLLLNVPVFFGSLYLLVEFNSNPKLSWPILLAINTIFDLLILGVFKLLTSKMIMLVFAEIIILTVSFNLFILSHLGGILG